MEAILLKQKLAELASERFRLADESDAFAIIDEHLDCLGSLDPELRDSLFYEAADAWIAGGLLDQEQLSGLTARLVSEEFLFKGIGAPAGNDVFRRTFSLLLLDAIVRRMNTAGPALAKTIAAAMERYVREECDLRGFVAPFGWAHAVAHAADVLASLLASPDLASEDGRILAMLKELLLKSPSVYTHQEDKRLARVLACHCRRHRDRRPGLLAWKEELLKACPPSFSDMEAYARRTNLLDLWRAWYFYVHERPEDAGIAADLEADIRILMRIPPD